MKSSLTAQRKGMIAKIHIAKQQLGLDDDVYRALLVNLTGQRSAAQLSLMQLERVLTELKNKGWKPTLPKVVRLPLRDGREPLYQKLLKLRKQLGASPEYVAGIAHKMFGNEEILQLDHEQLYKLVQAMQIAANRKNAKKAQQE